MKTGMASSAPTSSLRQLCDKFSRLSTEVEALFAETCDRARRDLTEQINQAVRRMRQAADREELAATLVDAASLFASAAAFLRIDGSAAAGERIRGVSAEAADRFVDLEVPLLSAAAIAGAVETRDPVTAAAVANEVSPELVAVFEHGAEARVTIFPIQVRDAVRAVLYTSGDVQAPAAEVLCQVAAAVWAAMEPVVVNVPEPPPELVQLEAPSARSRPTWESLSAGEQQIHVKAQRFARVQIAQIRLNEGQAVQSGRASRDIYGALRQRIDDARTVFRERFFAACPSMVDYLHLELLRTLAQDDADLLGKDYPGPLV